MHYYQFNISDYRKDTGHLSPLEHGIYRLLLDSLYLYEVPLTSDKNKLMRSLCIRTKEEKQAFSLVLEEFFILTEKGFVNDGVKKRLDQIYEKSVKARAAAKVRWDKEHAKSMRTHSDSNAEDMPPKDPITPLPKDPIKRLDQSSLDPDVLDFCFDQFWESGIRKVGKKNAKPLFAKILKKYSKPDGPTAYDFTNTLTNDVKKRLNANQLGFAEMHPTTYLNGERWDDEIKSSLPAVANGGFKTAQEKRADRNAEIFDYEKATKF